MKNYFTSFFLTLSITTIIIQNFVRINHVKHKKIHQLRKNKKINNQFSDIFGLLIEKRY